MTNLDWPTRAIGPREVGTVWRSGYWGSLSLVLAVIPGTGNWMGWAVHEVDCDPDGVALPGASVRTHCTAWDYDRDQVCEVPS